MLVAGSYAVEKHIFCSYRLVCSVTVSQVKPVTTIVSLLYPYSFSDYFSNTGRRLLISSTIIKNVFLVPGLSIFALYFEVQFLSEYTIMTYLPDELTPWSL